MAICSTYSDVLQGNVQFHVQPQSTPSTAAKYMYNEHERRPKHKSMLLFPSQTAQENVCSRQLKLSKFSDASFLNLLVLEGLQVIGFKAVYFFHSKLVVVMQCRVDNRFTP